MKRGGRTGLEKAKERGTSRKHGWNEEWRWSGHLGKRWFWGTCTEWSAECIRCHAFKSSQGLSLLNFIIGLGRKHRNKMMSWRYSKVKGRERKIEPRFELDLWTSMPGTLYSSKFYQWYSLVVSLNCLIYPLLWPHSRAIRGSLRATGSGGLTSLPSVLAKDTKDLFTWLFFFFNLQPLSVFVFLVKWVLYVIYRALHGLPRPNLAASPCCCATPLKGHGPSIPGFDICSSTVWNVACLPPCRSSLWPRAFVLFVPDLKQDPSWKVTYGTMPNFSPKLQKYGQ